MDKQSKINDLFGFFSSVLRRYHPKAGNEIYVKYLFYIT